MSLSAGRSDAADRSILQCGESEIRPVSVRGFERNSDSKPHWQLDESSVVF